jgi:hypothetical protein
MCMKTRMYGMLAALFVDDDDPKSKELASHVAIHVLDPTKTDLEEGVFTCGPQRHLGLSCSTLIRFIQSPRVIDLS